MYAHEQFAPTEPNAQYRQQNDQIEVQIMYRLESRVEAAQLYAFSDDKRAAVQRPTAVCICQRIV